MVCILCDLELPIDNLVFKVRQMNCYFFVCVLRTFFVFVLFFHDFFFIFFLGICVEYMARKYSRFEKTPMLCPNLLWMFVVHAIHENFVVFFFFWHKNQCTRSIFSLANSSCLSFQKHICDKIWAQNKQLNYYWETKQNREKIEKKISTKHLFDMRSHTLDKNQKPLLMFYHANDVRFSSLNHTFLLQWMKL